MAYQGLIFQGYEYEFGACYGLASGAAKIKASVSGNPAIDREFVGIGVQSSSVMNMNLGFGAYTYIKRNEKWIS